MKKVSKAARIRRDLLAGQKPAAIAKHLKVPIQSVYTASWKLKKELMANSKHRMMSSATTPEKVAKPSPALDFLREELANVERKIDNLNTVASFLAIRLRQMEQNGE